MAHPSAQYIGQRLRTFRRQRNMKLHEVAAKRGMSVQMVSYYERGEADLPVFRALAFAAVLGCQAVDLLPLVGNDSALATNSTEGP